MGHATLSRAGGRPNKLFSLSGLALLLLLIFEEMYLLSNKHIFSFTAVIFLCIFAVSAFARSSFHVRVIFLIALAVSATCMVWLRSIEPLWIGLHRAEVFGAFIPAVIFLRASFQDYSKLFADVQVNGSARPNPLLRALTGNYALGSLLNVGSLHLLSSNLTSVLASFFPDTQFKSEGERVVHGQCLIQGAPDLFLGFGKTSEVDFYVRQLRDMKGGISVGGDGINTKVFPDFAKLFGWALANAHARSGDPAVLAGYCGKSEALDDALVEFSIAYSKQNEADYATFLKAIKSGKVSCATENF